MGVHAWGGGGLSALHLFDDLCEGHISRQKLKPNGETKERRGCVFYGVCVFPGRLNERTR